MLLFSSARSFLRHSLGMCAILNCLVLPRPGLGLLTLRQRTDIGDFVKNLVQCRNVSGLSLGVIFGDGNNTEDVYTEGFGYSDVEQNVTVTNSTQFALGAISATFTTTLVSKLLHVNKAKYPQGWDTTVKEILGKDFKLSDPLRTKYTTLRDLAAHKTGYHHYETLMAGLDHSITRSEYCSRYFLLRPKYEFRADFHYSKEMFTLLGCVTEVLGGSSLEELMTSYLFNHLGMTSSLFVNSAQNLAVPYVHHNGSFLRLDTDLLRAIYPGEAAEGVASTAEDMVKWLHYHLLNVANMTQGGVLEQTYLPQVQYRLDQMAESKPESRVNQVVFAHNLGWESGQYKGFMFIQQSGKLPGFTSKISVFRDIKLGIFIGMNSGSSKLDSMTADLITWHIADLLLNVPGHMLFLGTCHYENPFAHEGILPLGMHGPQLSQPRRPKNIAKVTTPAPTPRELQWEKAYSGTYGHQLFGNITISYDSQQNALEYRTGVVGNGTLLDSGKQEMFMLKFEGPLSYMHKVFPEKNIKMYFENLKEGHFTQLRLPDDQLKYVRSVTWDMSPNSVQRPAIGVGLVMMAVSLCFAYLW